jgi:hypothetical protein
MEVAVDGDIPGEALLAQKPSKVLFLFSRNCKADGYYSVPNLPRTPIELGVRLDIPDLNHLISRFLYEQEHLVLDIPLDDVPLTDLPQFEGNIHVFPSAISIYYAPSDKSGIRGMFRERIRAVESWRNGPARYDCIFVEQDPDLPGFRGLFVAHVRAFFSITHNKVKYPCALVSWFSTVGHVWTLVCGRSSRILTRQAIVHRLSFTLIQFSVEPTSWVSMVHISYLTI